MTFSLFLKECKAIMFRIIYIVFILIAILFYVTQLVGDDGFPDKDIEGFKNNNIESPLTKPIKGQKSYGEKHTEIPEQVIPNALSMLEMEYNDNNYVAYPTGFYKNVKLNESDQKRIGEIINEVKGITDYEVFKTYMEEADKIIGGESQYALTNLNRYGTVEITYEEKLTEYNDLIEKDKISGAYARLFCDYMGIVIALFSVFVPVSYGMRDRRANMNELIYSRKINSSKLIITRYFALVFMMILPFILLSIIPTIKLLSFGNSNGFSVDAFAFLKYIFAWLLPTLLTTTSLGLFLTILTDTPIGILVQFIWSFLGIFTSMIDIGGGTYGMALNIRHNIIGNYQVYIDGMSNLIFNRVFYTVIPLLILALIIIIYELKRRGKLDVLSNVKNIFRRNKSTSKANPAL